eukprot:jgi/Picre1/35429/NNA_002891.t1
MSKTTASDLDNPRVFFDIEINNEELGRIVFVLFANVVPKTVENFRALCTGEKGVVLMDIGCGTKAVRFTASSLGLCAGGDFTNGDGTGGESIYGKVFEDENFIEKHTEAGLLSMANAGPGTNGSQFFLTTESTPWLDGKHVVFGKVVEGMAVVRRIENCGSRSGSQPVAEARKRLEALKSGGGTKAFVTAQEELKKIEEQEKTKAAEVQHEEEESQEEEKNMKKQKKQTRRAAKSQYRIEARLQQVRAKMKQAQKSNESAVVNEAKSSKLKAMMQRDMGIQDDGDGRKNGTKKRTEGIKPDIKEYEAAKAKDPEFYRTSDSMLYGGAGGAPKEAVDRMVAELEDRKKKASQFSRRRKHREDDDIDYINDRNAHFNKKIERAFGAYTKETKANLERGSALPEN